MKPTDIFMVKEPIPYKKNGRHILVIYARNCDGTVFFGCEGGYSQLSLNIFEMVMPSPTLAAFIEEAKAYFTPKKSCGDLTMEDLKQLWIEPIAGSVEHWALSRNIQLPENK